MNLLRSSSGDGDDDVDRKSSVCVITENERSALLQGRVCLKEERRRRYSRVASGGSTGSDGENGRRATGSVTGCI